MGKHTVLFLGSTITCLKGTLLVPTDFLTGKILYGESLFAKGKLEEAEICFLSILKDSFKIGEILNNLGVIAFHKSDIHNSILYFELALKINPFNKPVLINFFEIYKSSKKPYIFLPFVKKFLDRYPDDKEVAQILRKAVQYDLIEEKSQKFIGREKGKDIAFLNLKKIENANEEEKEQTEKMKLLIESLNQDKYQINKPHRNLIITGIPKSGMASFSKVLNKIDNIVCFDDVFEDVDALPQVFCNIRKTLTESYNISNSQANITDYDEDVIVGLKQNLAYLKLNALQGLRQNELETLINNYGYRTIAIIRDPVQTIAGWNAKQAIHFPEFMVTDDNLSPRWKNIHFASQDKIERQAQIWEFYAELLWALRGVIRIYTYEQLTLCFDYVLKDVCNFLALQVSISMRNLDDSAVELQHDNSDEIKKAVMRFCPTRLQFGYSDTKSQGEIPGIMDSPSHVFTGTHAQTVSFDNWTGGLVMAS